MVRELRCEKFASTFKQYCSAGGKKKKRKGDKVHLVVEKVCRNMIAIMFIIFNGWVVGSRVTRQTNDRILVKRKNKSVKFCTVQSLKRRILLLWLVRKKNWTNFAVDFSAQYSNAQYLMDFATLFISSMNHNASSATFPCGSSVKDQRRKRMPSIPLWIVS